MEARIRQQRPWIFSRSDGAIISPRLVLLPNGEIAGYRHPNESRWEFRQGYLCFSHASGAVSTRFDALRLEPDRRLRARGTYLYNTVDFKHELTEAEG